MLVDVFWNYFQVKEVASNVFGAVDMRWKALAIIALQEVMAMLKYSVCLLIN